MKKLIPFLIGSVLITGAVGCQNAARTSADAPETTDQAAEAPDAETAQQTQEDATSEVRRDQLNADIRAREQRDQALGDGETRDDGDLESEVRSKLEANLPASQLAVEAEDGAVTVTGTVPTPEQLERIEPLAREIRGVQTVANQAEVAPATPQ